MSIRILNIEICATISKAYILRDTEEKKNPHNRHIMMSTNGNLINVLTAVFHKRSFGLSFKLQLSERTTRVKMDLDTLEKSTIPPF